MSAVQLARVESARFAVGLMHRYNPAGIRLFLPLAVLAISS
jgi:hypothetical protein